jgi:hypothetical protein
MNYLMISVPAEKVRGFVLHLCLHMYVKMADPSKLSASGVGGGYVDNRLAVSYSQQGLNERNFLCQLYLA